MAPLSIQPVNVQQGNHDEKHGPDKAVDMFIFVKEDKKTSLTKEKGMF